MDAATIDDAIKQPVGSIVTVAVNVVAVFDVEPGSDQNYFKATVADESGYCSIRVYHFIKRPMFRKGASLLLKDAVRKNGDTSLWCVSFSKISTCHSITVPEDIILDASANTDSQITTKLKGMDAATIDDAMKQSAGSIVTVAVNVVAVFDVEPGSDQNYFKATVADESGYCSIRVYHFIKRPMFKQGASLLLKDAVRKNGDTSLWCVSFSKISTCHSITVPEDIILEASANTDSQITTKLKDAITFSTTSQVIGKVIKTSPIKNRVKDNLPMRDVCLKDEDSGPLVSVTLFGENAMQDFNNGDVIRLTDTFRSKLTESLLTKKTTKLEFLPKESLLLDITEQDEMSDYDDTAASCESDVTLYSQTLSASNLSPNHLLLDPNNEIYRSPAENWKITISAIKYLRDGLLPFVNETVLKQHSELMSKYEKGCNECTFFNLLPKHAEHKLKKLPCPFKLKKCPCLENDRNLRRECPNNVCGIIYDGILNAYFFQPPTPCWRNTDVSKWNTDAWEIAKCFISFPGYLKKTGPAEIDCTGLLHMLVNNKAFHHLLQHEINGKDIYCRVRSNIDNIYRNPEQELTQDDMNEYLLDMIKVLEDGKYLQNRKECREAVCNIKKLITDDGFSDDSDDHSELDENIQDDSEVVFEENGGSFENNDEHAVENQQYTSRYQDEFNHVCKIGSGAYGVVLHATLKIDKQPYAIKRIVLPKRDGSKGKMMREVEALAQLDHANIVRYFSSWIETPPEGWQEKQDANNEISLSSSQFNSSESSNQDSLNQPAASSISSGTASSGYGMPATLNPKQPRSYLFIQMQLCKTDTLQHWLDKNKGDRDKRIVLKWFEQVTDAIRYVHEKNLVHRDLKPANIFFTQEDNVKIGDFGLATAVDENDEALYYREVGTSVYRSPEIKAKKGTVKSEKVDIFSMGVILFELLHPFETKSERAKVLEDLHKYKYPEDFEREMPTVTQLVSRLTAIIPDERPSAKEILLQHLPSLLPQDTTQN